MRRNRRFALQAVLDYRRHLEDAAQQAVAEHGRAFEPHRRQVAGCDEAAKAHTEFLRADGMLRLADAHACERQLAALERHAARHAVAAEEARATLDAAKRYAVEASRERRAIEILRDRHLAALAAAECRAEEEEIAETGATAVASRRSKEPAMRD